jgi:hypothetical protein
VKVLNLFSRRVNFNILNLLTTRSVGAFEYDPLIVQALRDNGIILADDGIIGGLIGTPTHTGMTHH